MNTKPKSKREYIVDSLLLCAGVVVTMESANIILIQLGWRERGRSFDNSVMFLAPVAFLLGVYVFVQASRRMTGRKQAHERKLAEFHELAEGARAASKQS